MQRLSTHPTQSVCSRIGTEVRPKDRPTGSSDAKLLAARNEFESFQIVIQAGSSILRDARVTLSGSLTGPGGSTIPANNMTIYREDYFNVVTRSDQEGDAGLWPDALIPARDPWFDQPRNAFPIDVPAEENRVALGRCACSPKRRARHIFGVDKGYGSGLRCHRADPARRPQRHPSLDVEPQQRVWDGFPGCLLSSIRRRRVLPDFRRRLPPECPAYAGRVGQSDHHLGTALPTSNVGERAALSAAYATFA
jgi:hypothetical protein